MSIDSIFQAAQATFLDYKNLSGKEKGHFLETLAEILESNRAAIVPLAVRESNLPEGRINGELGRTTGQIRLFANLVKEGSWVEATIDPAMPDRSPLPRADIRRILTPLGPVVVFGAKQPKKNDKAPDWTIMKSKPREDMPAPQPRVLPVQTMLTDDDIPF